MNSSHFETWDGIQLEKLSLEDEVLFEKCELCKKSFKRKDVDQYSYYRGLLFCSDHPGVDLWYKLAIALSSAVNQVYLNYANERQIKDLQQHFSKNILK